MAKDLICTNCPLFSRPQLPQVNTYNPDILFVGGYPMEMDCKVGPFSSRDSSVLRSIVDNIKRTRAGMDRLLVNYSYACQCSPEYDKAKKKFKINAEIVEKCSVILKNKIDVSKPKVIVALGDDAIRALGFKGILRDMRGGIYSFKSDTVEIPVIVTFHVYSLSKQPGYVNTFIKDINKALAIVTDSLQTIDMDLRLPKTCSEIIAELDNVLAEANKKDMKLAVAVDTETTSLTPYVREDRVIMISMSYKNGLGLAYPFEHKACKFTESEFQQIKAKTEEVLSNDKVFLVFANGKFDYQWLKYNYGLKMNDIQYDIILAEHVIDEDKKGEYSLKDITCDRFPSMGKYEEELKKYLADTWEKKDLEIEKLKEKHKESLEKIIIDWWVGLDVDKRKEIYTSWVEKGYVALSDIQDLAEVKYRKFRGKLVIPKKYTTTLTKLVRSVPLSELEKHFEIPKLNIPSELLSRTYEDVDFDVLQRYAAIDALTTRLILRSQQSDFTSDKAMIQATEKHLGVKIPTRMCYEVMYDNTFPLCQCLTDMEYNGVRLDRDKCASFIPLLQDKIDEAKDVMFTELGHKFDPNKDLIEVLYNELKLPIKKYTKTGEPSTDADVIKELYDEFNMPALEKILVYRKIDKCLNTYIKNWYAISAYDGKLHAKFNQFGTATYRLSSSDPNLQNVPFQLKEAGINLKSLFLPDNDNFELYDLDIKNAEMRVLTAYSKDKNLTDAFNHGKDLHCLTAAGISDYTYDDIKKYKDDKTTDQYRKRQLAKKVNFGTIYCMSAERLQQQLWSELRIKEPVEKCQEYLSKFFETYPGVYNYIEETKNFVARFCYTWTYTGRRRRFAITKYNSSQGARMGRQAVNARIQTTSSDLVMYNLIDLFNWMKPLGGRLILTVHDSLLFQLPKGVGSILSDIKNIITDKTAERAPWLPVAWDFDVGKGENYGDTHCEVL